METSYPRLEKPDRKWIGKFFWNSAWISGGIVAAIIFVLVRYESPTGNPPLSTESGRGLLQFTFLEYAYGILQLTLLAYIIFSTVKGYKLALKNQSSFMQSLPRALLLLLQLFMLLFTLVLRLWVAN